MAHVRSLVNSYGIMCALLGCLVAFQSAFATAIAPPSEIIEAKVTPSCIKVLPWYPVKDAGTDPTIRIFNKCSETLLLSDVLTAKAAKDTRKSVLPLTAILIKRRLDEKGWTVHLEADGGNCTSLTQKDVPEHESAETCKAIPLATGGSVILPMPYDTYYSLTAKLVGTSAMVSVVGHMVTFASQPLPPPVK